MPPIRVFLLTYQRPHLLRRAMESLRGQTMADWICEVHNDDPSDRAPAQVLQEIRDPRFELCQHPKNLGAVASFNLAYAGGPETFAAILEDDNTWDPTFLEKALAALRNEPRANVVWSNLRYVEEKTDGTWCATGQTIWQVTAEDEHPRLIFFPQPLQFHDALHSQGAMVFRATASRKALVPPETPLAIIEAVRERLVPGGWLLLPQPLGTFAVTLKTARSQAREHWASAQMLIALSYLASRPADPPELGEIVRRLGAQKPAGIPLLINLAVMSAGQRSLLGHVNVTTWLRYLASAAYRPASFFRLWRLHRQHRNLLSVLSRAANDRVAENAAHPGKLSLFAKKAA